MAEQAGVTFLFNRSVDRLLVEGDKIAGVQCGEEVFKADSYVVAFGSYSTALLRGPVSIPVYPLKGYSLTIPITDEAAAPFSTVLDETYKIAITRFDQRIRVGGMAEIVGFNTQLEQKRRETLEMVVRDLYPNGGRVADATFDRPAADDTGRHANCRPHFAEEPVSQYRAWHVGLDDGLRFRAAVVRSDVRHYAGDPSDDLAVARYSAGFRQQHAVPLNDVHPAR